MNRELLNEIVETYEKYEWNLKTIIFAESIDDETAERLGSQFPKVEIRVGTVDSAWFSRPSKNNHQAWELRYISEQQLALFETFPNDFDESECVKFCNEMESRLLELTSKK